MDHSNKKEKTIDIYFYKWMNFTNVRHDKKNQSQENIHAIMNDDKPQDVLSASWSPRRAAGVVPAQMPIRLRPRKSMGFSSSTKAGKK